jgi:hypothetical protein
MGYRESIMRRAWFAALLLASTPAHGAPPPDVDGRFSGWFRGLAMPGTRTPCCDIADCRMVEARRNSKTRHYEAKVVREVFSNALRGSQLYSSDNDAYRAALSVWLKNWMSSYGDVPEVWIEIADARVNHVDNPTGRAVLCWTAFWGESNGVFCFVPFSASANEYTYHFVS